MIENLWDVIENLWDVIENLLDVIENLLGLIGWMCQSLCSVIGLNGLSSDQNQSSQDKQEICGNISWGNFHRQSEHES